MTDQPATVPVWQDGDPLMEAIAAAVYEHCEVQRGSGLVIDDPRNIAAAATAGIRDAARQAAGQPAAAEHVHRLGNADEDGGILDDWDNCRDPHCPGPTAAEIARARQAAVQLDPTTADDPTPLRWGLGDVLYGDDDTTIICLSGPNGEPYWLELDPEHAAALRDDLAGPDGPPAAGQPDTQQQAEPAPVVAYRDPRNPRVLLCRDHGRKWHGVVPLTADDLPDGGICVFGRLSSFECGRDVLADEAAR